VRVGVDRRFDGGDARRAAGRRAVLRPLDFLAVAACFRVGAFALRRLATTFADFETVFRAGVFLRREAAVVRDRAFGFLVAI
jgi:hypothetical protein